jgi:hypothetical protein
MVLTSFANAAQISPRDRDNALAACDQTHDTCLQSCNAAYPAGGGFLKEADLLLCQNGCTSAYSACTASVNRMGNSKKDKLQKLDNLPTLTPN